MSKKIFISYAGRTVKSSFDGDSLKDLEQSFTAKFPNSTAHFVFYTTDSALGVEYELDDVSDLADGSMVSVKLCDASGATFGTSMDLQVYRADALLWGMPAM
jgi:hypothetical protein